MLRQVSLKCGQLVLSRMSDPMVSAEGNRCGWKLTISSMLLLITVVGALLAVLAAEWRHRVLTEEYSLLLLGDGLDAHDARNYAIVHKPSGLRKLQWDVHVPPGLDRRLHFRTGVRPTYRTESSRISSGRHRIELVTNVEDPVGHTATIFVDGLAQFSARPLPREASSRLLRSGGLDRRYGKPESRFAVVEFSVPEWGRESDFELSLWIQ